MSHFVTGLIARRSVLLAFAEKHELHGSTPLSQGLEILPLREDDINSFLTPPLTNQHTSFSYLSDQLLQELLAASLGESIVYFETEYFGGEGSQGAVVVSDGKLVYGPALADIGPINQALAMLGVAITPPAHDEFDSVGLAQHRSTEDWIEAFKRKYG
jgi:hypothetical protein